MAIFLTGGGDQEHFQKLDFEFIKLLDDNAELLVVPQANDPEEFNDILERIEDVFQSKKISSIDLCLDPTSYSLEDLMTYNAIIIEGGNTFQLIKAIRETSFFSHLKKFADSNKHIYADSAGAILLGHSVESAFLGEDGDEDHLKLQDYRGLNILDEWCVHAHFEADDLEDLENLLYDKGSPIIALAEEAGVLIMNNTMESLGSTDAKLITFSGIENLGSNEVFSY